MSALLALVLISTAMTVVPAVREAGAESVPGAIDRVGGMDRIDTALATVFASNQTAATEVFITSSTNPADGLVAGAAAGVPLVLVPPTGDVPLQVPDEIGKLGAQVVTVVGGTGAVSDHVAAAAASGRSLQRIAGINRYETAIALSQYRWSSAGTVYLARGDSFADAIVASTLREGPVLLVADPDDIEREVRAEVERLGATRVIGIGGTAAISDDALMSLRSVQREVYRLSGADRYETAAAVARYKASDSSTPIVITRSDAFADALAASNIERAVVLLVPSCAGVPEATASALRDRRGTTEVLVLGGDAAVCGSTFDAVADLTGTEPVVHEGQFADEEPLEQGAEFEFVSPENFHPYAEWRGPPWRPSTISYAFTSIPGGANIEAVTWAMRQWERSAHVRFVPAADTGSAQLRIGFGTVPNGWLAGATVGAYPGRSTLTFRDTVAWTAATRIGNGPPFDLATTALHELGHVLGLTHPPNQYYQCDRERSAVVRTPISVMASYCGSNRYPTESDRAELGRHYRPGDIAPAPTPPDEPPDDRDPGGGSGDGGPLTVTLTENPYVCDGGTRHFGVVSGASPGETITFSSPELGVLRAGAADGGGSLGIVWQCDPGDEGSTWTVTARGGSSGRAATFTVTGAAPGSDDSDPGRDSDPGEEVPATSVSLSKGPSAQGQPNCRSVYCAYLHVTLNGFADGAHDIVCYSTYGGAFYTYEHSSPDHNYCYFGHPGYDVWVTVDGIASNRVTW